MNVSLVIRQRLEELGLEQWELARANQETGSYILINQPNESHWTQSKAANPSSEKIQGGTQTQDHGLRNNYSSGLRTRRPQVQVLPGAPFDTPFVGLRTCSWQATPRERVQPSSDCSWRLSNPPKRPCCFPSLPS